MLTLLRGAEPGFDRVSRAKQWWPRVGVVSDP